jgi:hypothetical protein
LDKRRRKNAVQGELSNEQTAYCSVVKRRSKRHNKEKRKMKNLNNEGFKTTETKVRSPKGWRMLFAVMLVTAFAALSTAGSTQTALADAGVVKGHTFDVTFTKWITTFPNMAGVVGGAVGHGTFKGEILKIGTVGDITSIEALYHVNGRKHSFTAHVYVTQDNAINMAVIIGSVTEGWQKGAPVIGEYKVWATCPIPSGNSPCFQGTLHVLEGGGG